MYTITSYTKRKARQLGVQVRPSTNKKKKVDVYKNGKKIASIGARGYGDYPTFMKTHGQAFANKKRRLYKQRHQKDRRKKNTNGYFADQLLW
jgi:hypothetical protein